MEGKKNRGIFQRINDWWDNLTPGKKVACVCATWFCAGLGWGSVITSYSDKGKTRKLMDISYDDGLRDGKLDAYKEMAVETMKHHNPMKKF